MLLSLLPPPVVWLSRWWLRLGSRLLRRLTTPKRREPLTLPFELILHILSFDAFSSLDVREAYELRNRFWKSVSLVCTTLTPLAQEQLRQQLRVTRYFEAHHCYLDNDAKAASRVRELTIEDDKNMAPMTLSTFLRRCENVEVLSLGEMPARISTHDLNQLRRFHLRNGLLAARIPTPPPSLSSLEHLSLHNADYTYFDRHKSRLEIAHVFPSVTALSLHNGPSSLAGFFPSLRRLAIYDDDFLASYRAARLWNIDPSFPTELELLATSPATLDGIIKTLLETGGALSVQMLMLDPHPSRPVNGNPFSEEDRKALTTVFFVLAASVRSAPPPPPPPPSSSPSTSHPSPPPRRKAVIQHLHRISLSASFALDPSLRPTIARIFRLCKASGIECAYHAADASRSMSAREANAGAFRGEFWGRVVEAEREERRRARWEEAAGWD
ncbi:hypothetical protein JCM8097_005902 [Rhodosporidiobolus ruineniae]